MRTQFGTGKSTSRQMVLNSFPRPCQRVLILTTPEMPDIHLGWELGRFNPDTEFVIPEFLPDRFQALQYAWARLGRRMKATFYRAAVQEICPKELGQFDAAWIDSYNTVEQLFDWIQDFLKPQKKITFWATVFRGRHITTARTNELIHQLQIPDVHISGYHDSSPMTTFGGTWIRKTSPTICSVVS